MLRSLYSGISGLRANQTMMDVVGNNIANVNTTGFKASQVTFQEALSQTAQFSVVEKLTDLVNQNQTLLSTDAVVGVTSLLGRSVSWTGTDGADHTGVVSGAKFGTSGAVLRIGDQDVPLDLIKEVGSTGA